MKKIKFVKNFGNYKKGLMYDVNRIKALVLVKGGFADYYEIQVPKYKDRMMKPKFIK